MSSPLKAVWLVLGAALVTGAAAFPAPGRDAETRDVEVDTKHWLPGPAGEAQRSAQQLALEHACRRCHQTHARQWASSQHATSWTSSAFQSAFEVEPLPFCQGCHAPEASPVAEVSTEAAQTGVGCVTCHLDPASTPDEPIVWTATTEGSASAEAPHTVRRSPAFADSRVCGGCHEFGFPDAAWRDQPLAMQSTLTEHAASKSHARSCNDCHMPQVDGHRDHGFPGAYDSDMLAQSLRIDVRRTSPTTVQLHLRPGQVGHAVPTGDLLRRLEVALEVQDDDRTRTVDRRWLGRRFEPQAQADGLTVLEETSDDRVGPDGRRVELELPRGYDPATPLRWRVTHQRVAHGSADPRTARIEGDLDIQTGPVAPWVLD